MPFPDSELTYLKMRLWPWLPPSLAYKEKSCGLTTSQVASPSYVPGRWGRRALPEGWQWSPTTHWFQQRKRFQWLMGDRSSSDFSPCVGAKGLWRNSEKGSNWRSDTPFQLLHSSWNISAHVRQKKPKKWAEMCEDSMSLSEALCSTESIWGWDGSCLQ